MKSVSHHVKKKFKTVQEIVHGQDSVVVVVAVAFLFREKLLTIEALDMM